MIRVWLGILSIILCHSITFAQSNISLGLQLEPPNLDPTSGAAAAIDEVVYGNIFEGLVKIDQNGNVQPGLALSWDISVDGRSYVFYLAEGVTFHDGTEFHANDIKYSFNRARAAGSTNAKKLYLLILPVAITVQFNFIDSPAFRVTC